MDVKSTREGCGKDNNSIQQKIVAKSSTDSRRMEEASKYRDGRGDIEQYLITTSTIVQFYLDWVRE